MPSATQILFSPAPRRVRGADDVPGASLGPLCLPGWWPAPVWLLRQQQKQRCWRRHRAVGASPLYYKTSTEPKKENK